MFQFPGFASHCWDTLAGGFPHSEIHGSKLVRSSPWLIAAYHVLHRLSAPRHPPNTLKALDRSHCRCPSDLSILWTRRLPISWKDLIHSRVSSDCNRRLTTTNPPQTCACSDRTNLLFTMSMNTSKSPRRADLDETDTDEQSPASHSWWSQTGSNRRPHACKARALPTELWPLNQG